MHHSIIEEICKNVVEEILRRLLLLKLEIKEDIEKTDSGVLRTIESNYKKSRQEKYIHINKIGCPFCPDEDDGGFIYDEAQDFWFCLECFRRNPFLVDENGATEFIKGEDPITIVKLID